MNNINQKGIAQLILLVIIVGALIVGVYLVKQKTNLLPKASSPYGTINTEKDLERTQSELNSVDTNQLDQGINENASDASGF